MKMKIKKVIGRAYRLHFLKLPPQIFLIFNYCCDVAGVRPFRIDDGTV
jgi:hypothetical protein